MESLESLWEKIDSGLKVRDSTLIEQIHQDALCAGNEQSANREEYFYAAGYVAYMHRDGRENLEMRSRATSAFLRALFHYPGYLPALLYLGFIRMDDGDYLGALSILYSVAIEEERYDVFLVDRFFEARVCCLIECNYWEVALRELHWFELRIKEDCSVGIDLINFMKLVEDKTAKNSLEAEVIRAIRSVLKLAH